MIAVAKNYNYLCNNEIYIDSDYSKSFEMDIAYGKNDIVDDCKQYPYSIMIENENRKFNISCSRAEIVNLIEKLTQVLKETE